MKNIILIAVQGAGKGTVAKALAEKYNYVHISTGDLLRERRTMEDEIGRAIIESQDSGVLTPKEIVYKVLEEKLCKPECCNGYILDGFPRTVEQAEVYDEILKRLNKDIGIVVNMTVPDEVLVERITSRRSCSKCGKIYSMSFEQMKPKIDGKCDDCDGNLIFRDDDRNEDAIRTRINIYHENSQSLIDFYKEKGILFNVESTSSKEAFTQIEKLIYD